MNLSAIEIVDIAKRVEAAGEAFYEAALDVLPEGNVRDTFAFLRNEERRHAHDFEALLADVKGASDPWRQEEDYGSYMRVLAEDRVFPDAEVAVAAVKGISTEADAVAYARRFEQDSIRFLEAMQEVVHASARPTVDALLAEERSHLAILDKLL